MEIGNVEELVSGFKVEGWMEQEVDRVIAQPLTAAGAAGAAPSSAAAAAAAAAAALRPPLPLRPAVFSSFHRRSVGRRSVAVGRWREGRPLACSLGKGQCGLRSVRPSARARPRPPACLTPKSSPSAPFPDC